MSFRAFEFPDDPNAGDWKRENFRFFSEYAAKVNGEMAIFDARMAIMEAVLRIAGGPGSASILQSIKSRRCAYMARCTAVLKDARQGSGAYGRTVRNCARSRKGEPKKRKLKRGPKT